MNKLLPMEFWEKYKHLIIIWLVVFVIIVFSILFIPDPYKIIGDIIQAQAVVTLVLITSFYANQTIGLVNEQKRTTQEQIKFRNQTKMKTDIDFAERRIDQFFHPLWMNLNIIHGLLYSNTVHAQTETDKIETELKSIYFNKSYMTKIDDKIYRDLLTTIGILAIENRNNFKEAQTLRSEYDKEWKSFSKIFNEEWDKIGKEIFSYYMPGESCVGEKSANPPPSSELKL